MEASEFLKGKDIGGWTNDFKLYQPVENNQLLLPDKASCLAVQAFFKMCELDFKVYQRENAEDMSPSGQVPFLKCGMYLVSGLEAIIKFVDLNGISLTKHLDDCQRSEIKAYFSLVNHVLGNGVNYFTWADKANFNSLTKRRFSSVYPWPLNWVVLKQKQKRVLKTLQAMNWSSATKTKEDVLEEIETCLNALSNSLGNKLYFFGDKPTELDAIVFAYIFAVLSKPLTEVYLGEIIKEHPRLIEHCKRIINQYFSDISLDSEDLMDLH